MIYLIAGSQTPILKKNLARLLDERLGTIDHFNLSRLDGREVLAQDIAFEASMLPLGTARKAVVIESPYFLLKEKSKVKIDKDQDYRAMLDFITSPNEEVDLIFLSDSLALDEKNEVLKAIRQHGNVTIIPDLDQTKWFDYGKAYFKNNNASIDNDALKELIERVNGDLNAFINEANKLILYKNRINLIDVTLMIAKPLENNIFALTKALFRGDKASALDIFADLRTNNVEPITLVSMLANQFRLMSQIRYLDQRGLSQASIAKELGLPDFRIRMSLQDSRRLSRTAIINNLDTLYQLDLNIKSGLIDRYYAFELFILNFA
ncbi:MAG: DNA polymerase III subunit delta [Bacilli bacterium]|nr:DNA polymerase III subunit delta [Bacilli bacterium]MDD4006258.1 DNA polymerase III subunit delta [Bacilli bacterium]